MQPPGLAETMAKLEAVRGDMSDAQWAAVAQMLRALPLAHHLSRIEEDGAGAVQVACACTCWRAQNPFQASKKDAWQVPCGKRPLHAASRVSLRCLGSGARANIIAWSLLKHLRALAYHLCEGIRHGLVHLGSVR